MTIYNNIPQASRSTMTAAAATPCATAAGQLSLVVGRETGALCRALYTNHPEAKNELAFRKGDILTVIEYDHEGQPGWWLCALRGQRVRNLVKCSNKLYIIALVLTNKLKNHAMCHSSTKKCVFKTLVFLSSSFFMNFPSFVEGKCFKVYFWNANIRRSVFFASWTNTTTHPFHIFWGSFVFSCGKS